MKINFRLIIPLIALLLAVSCKKDSGVEGSKIVYEETISGIKKHEPLLLTFRNSNNTTKVEWTVTPSTQTIVSAVGNTATITFALAGDYIVLAKAGDISAKYTVNVSNVEYEPYGNTFNLSASKLVNINNDEAVIFSVHNAQAGSAIAWSVYSQSYNLMIDTANNTAAVTFTGGGFGVVDASDGVSTQRRTVWVNSPANSNPNQDTVSFIVGEKLQLTPSIQSVGGVKQLVISATTLNPYHCASDKILSFSLNNNYMIDYAGVAISPQPCSPASVASCSNSFNNIPVGTHNFVINFGNKTFTGSLNVSSVGVYTFTWPDSSLINISPLTLP